MEKVKSIAAEKRIYCAEADKKQRGFFAYLRRLQKDAEAAEADAKAEEASINLAEAQKVVNEAQKRAKDMQRAAKKDAQKQAAADAAQTEADAAQKAAEEAQKEAQTRKQAAAEARKQAEADAQKAEDIRALREVMQRKGLRAEDITKDYLLSYLPYLFDESKNLCKVIAVSKEDAQQTREDYEKKQLSNLLVTREDALFIYSPIRLFTAKSLLDFFTKAADAKKKQLSAAAKEAKAKEDAAKYARRIAEYKRIIAQYEEEEAKKAEAAK